MIADEYEAERDPSAPIDMLEDYFGAHGWSCERVGDDEVVATVSGSWTQYELRAVWRDDDRVLQFLGFPDIRVADDKRALIYETIGLINEQLWVGHFELWAKSGILLFRHAVILEGGDPSLTMEQAETLVDAALDECERFYPVFQFVLWGGKTPAEALAAALIETHGEA
ncbi:YbjN domain-containing protein [Sphingomonas sp. ID0503]|uniref:YbjN domain-containing protein n=1 Tax=Sphingomonas sp. ID0503 TaxID=3399691 RepID=UPI003AFB283C